MPNAIEHLAQTDQAHSVKTLCKKKEEKKKEDQYRKKRKTKKEKNHILHSVRSE